ncbi:cytidine deaminase [Anaerotalea alkaliphila]|uniref:Cytidine deaminase n=1 Tax=Anaerotalea alkaliphila TaxID=2662126 RepID=A0A7X5HWW0_9FIRM|nr:cytidine deaminase [Anaerotalea alkaliphila]NDL68154.1 cytidine deaminase [Anaerotalea alkaliphila]
MTDEELMEQARRAMDRAYAPYSRFRVGAAISTASGRVFTGCNVENASFGATNCAERTAVFKAVSEGEKGILKVAIAGSSGEPLFPCGICRQVLAEFMEPDGTVLVDGPEGIHAYRLGDLLPNSFDRFTPEEE